MSWKPMHQLQSRPYIIESVLGSGGFGITYKVHHLEHNQHFVIKTPLDHLKYDSNYGVYLRRFQKEGEKLKKLCKNPHSHIVQVIDFFKEAENPCLVMEYIPGENLYQLVKRQGALTQTQAVKVICQIGDALNFMHQAELVHRDATPLNIMMRTPEEAVLIDFGIAKGIDPATSTQTDIAGNRSFAPYEQVGKGSREKTVDVYSLAASLYYAVTGECATASLGRKMFDEELVPPQQLNPSISDRINQAILKGMALEPEDRPSSMGEWLGLLAPSTQTHQNLQAFELLSEKGVDYTQLRNLLAVGKWKEADIETARVMIKAVNREHKGWLRVQDINQFPCTDLHTIDQLWVKYSDGRFGFSVQKDIWLEVGGKVDYETEAKLCNHIGWRVKGELLSYSSLTFKLSAPLGHLPGLGVGRVLVGRLDGWFGAPWWSLFSRLQTCSLYKSSF
ncbi:MAG: protein kinase [Symploca sp. SIO2B6]|nr:protein kinase [Symploca sp. SIO2B6]